MLLGTRLRRVRCLTVQATATAALLGVCWVTVPVAAATVAALTRRGPAVPFDQALVGLSAAVLPACAGWLWLLATIIVAEAWRGRADPVHGPRGVPVVVRRVVLAACGVTLLAQPALAIGQPTGQRAVPESHPAGVGVLSGLPLPERAAAPPRSPAHHHGQGVVVVAPGDTLWAIAARDLPTGSPDSTVTRRWQAIYAANRAAVGPDPDLIVPGLRLHLPDRTPRERDPA